MKIESIDVYWARLPLAFVWKTSYADQYYTDTILVRMEGGGHSAWGESCPPLLPGYSAEHTLATFHTAPMPKDAFSGKLASANDVESASIFMSPDAVWLNFMKSMSDPTVFGTDRTDRFGSKGFVTMYALHRKAFEGAPGLIVTRTKK